MTTVLDELVALREQVALLAENAAQSSREYHETWSRQKALAARTEAEPGDPVELGRLRRREMLYLGEAATFQWILGRLDQVIQDAGAEPGRDQRLTRDQAPASSR